MVPECQTVWFSLFISLHFELETGPFFLRPGRNFQSGLWSQLTRPYGLVFFTVSKKDSGLGPDGTVASLQIREYSIIYDCTQRGQHAAQVLQITATVAR